VPSVFSVRSVVIRREPPEALKTAERVFGRVCCFRRTTENTEDTEEDTGKDID
jgi:hypothetical protein